MATYKGIQGFGVETLASDPTEARFSWTNFLQFYKWNF
jgi:hypothetical protein